MLPMLRTLVIHAEVSPEENAVFGEHENSLESAAFAGDETAPDKTSLVQFCEFVNYYARHSTNPLATSAVCAQQAETLRITAADATPETIRLLVDTMLNAIDQLEKKWLDEQIRCEEFQQAARRNPPRMPVPHSKRPQPLAPPQPPRLAQAIYQTGSRWLRKQFGHEKPLPKEAAAW